MCYAKAIINLININLSIVIFSLCMYFMNKKFLYIQIILFIIVLFVYNSNSKSIKKQGINFFSF